MHACNSSSEAVQTGGSLRGLCRERGEFQLQWGTLAHHTRGREIRKIYFVNFRPLHAYTHMHTDMQTNTQTHRIIHTSNSPCLLLRDIDLRAWEGTRGATGEMNNLTGYLVSEKWRKPPQFPCPYLFVLPQAVVGQRCSLLGWGMTEYIHNCLLLPRWVTAGWKVPIIHLGWWWQLHEVSGKWGGEEFVRAVF